MFALNIKECWNVFGETKSISSSFGTGLTATRLAHGVDAQDTEHQNEIQTWQITFYYGVIIQLFSTSQVIVHALILKKVEDHPQSCHHAVIRHSYVCWAAAALTAHLTMSGRLLPGRTGPAWITDTEFARRVVKRTQSFHSNKQHWNEHRRSVMLWSAAHSPFCPMAPILL